VCQVSHCDSSRKIKTKGHKHKDHPKLAADTSKPRLKTNSSGNAATTAGDVMVNTDFP